MNKRFVLAIALAAVAFLIAVSFLYKNIAVQKARKKLNSVHNDTKNSLYKKAVSLEAAGESEKAKRAFEHFLETHPNDKKKEATRKKIEKLNVKILFSDSVTKDSFLYEIKPGDTLIKIATKFHTTVELIKKSNGLISDMIFPGKFLKVPQAKFSIHVDRSGNRLLLLSNGKLFKSYTVSTGENLSTPVGEFYIEEKMIKPVWYKIGATVSPDSPEYELGSRWMGISKENYGIHGTNDESTIGKHITKGCVRMKNSDVEELYAIVPSGTEVVIVE
ncbi:MAG: L,D-transpeptidase family protein [Candidatus Omnitrophica bacterium]|nr:L,D-transpeptidase family protein [Candidatus Omnitrophota bacterium]